MGNIFSAQGVCPSRDLSQICDFATYANATSLTQDQKLQPNHDITGPNIVKAFIITAGLSILASLILLADEARAISTKKTDPDARYKTAYFRKLMQQCETLLQTFSDQQLVAGFSILVATSFAACDISAYHYNLVCTMVLMSLVTHINTLVNIPNFICKGWIVGTYRILAIVAMVILSAILFSARNTSTFPVSAGPLSVLPAVCFEARNGTTDLGFGDAFDYLNSSMTHQNFVSSPKSGFAQYGVLLGFFAFALVMLVLDGLKKMCCEPGPFKHWATWVFRLIPTIVSILIVIYATSQYSGLRSAMEVDQWYRIDLDNDKTVSQILPMALLASSSIAVAKAFLETWEGPGGKLGDALERGVTIGQKGYADIEMTKQAYSQVQQVPYYNNMRGGFQD